MKYENTLQYSNSIADMFNWNYTTYIRTHTWLTPELVQKWCNQISNRRCIDAVWSSIERDNANMNHLHLAISHYGFLNGSEKKTYPKNNVKRQ